MDKRQRHNIAYRRLLENLPILYSYGLTRLSILTDDDHVDLSLSALFSDGCEIKTCLQCSDYIDDLFLGWAVEFTWQNFADNNDFNESITISIPLIKPHELTINNVNDIIEFHAPKLRGLNVERIGVYKYPVRYGYPIELYAARDPYEKKTRYFEFLNIIESLFPGYEVNVTKREDIEPLYYETVLCDYRFFDVEDFSDFNF